MRVIPRGPGRLLIVITPEEKLKIQRAARTPEGDQEGAWLLEMATQERVHYKEITGHAQTTVFLIRENPYGEIK